MDNKIKYKYNGEVPDYVKNDLKECADKIEHLDKKMLSLYKVVSE